MLPGQVPEKDKPMPNQFALVKSIIEMGSDCKLSCKEIQEKLTLIYSEHSKSRESQPNRSLSYLFTRAINGKNALMHAVELNNFDAAAWVLHVYIQAAGENETRYRLRYPEQLDLTKELCALDYCVSKPDEIITGEKSDIGKNTRRSIIMNLTDQSLTEFRRSNVSQLIQGSKIRYHKRRLVRDGMYLRVQDNYRYNKLILPSIEFVEAAIKYIGNDGPCIWSTLKLAMQSNNLYFIHYFFDEMTDLELDFLKRLDYHPGFSCEMSCKASWWLIFKMLNHASRNHFPLVVESLLARLEDNDYDALIREDKLFQSTIQEVKNDYLKEAENIPLSCAIAHNDFKLADQLWKYNSVDINLLFQCRKERNLGLDKYPLNQVINYLFQNCDYNKVSAQITTHILELYSSSSTIEKVKIFENMLKVNNKNEFVEGFFQKVFNSLNQDEVLLKQMIKLPLFTAFIARMNNKKSQWLEIVCKSILLEPEIVKDGNILAVINSFYLNERLSTNNRFDNTSILFQLLSNPVTRQLIVENEEIRASISADSLNAIATTGDNADISPLYLMAKYPETCRLLHNDRVLQQKVESKTLCRPKYQGFDDGASPCYWLTKHEMDNNYNFTSYVTGSILNNTIREGSEKGYTNAYWMLFNPRKRRWLSQDTTRAARLFSSLFAETLNAVIPQGIWKGTTAAYWLVNTESGRLLLEQHPDLRKKVNGSSNLEHKMDLAILGPGSETALYNAAAQGHTAVVNQLLNDGWDANLPSQINGFTPLMAAARWGNIETIKILLRLKANINAQSSGDSALSLAVINDHLPVVKQLLESKSNPNALIGETKKSALHTAIWAENINLIQVLVDYKANLEVLNAAGRSPLDEAIKNKKLAACNVLMKNAARIRNPKELHDLLKDADQRDPNVVSCWEFLANYLLDLDNLPNGFTEADRRQIETYAKKLRMLHKLVNAKIVYAMAEVSLNFMPNPLLSVVESYHETHLENYHIEFFNPQNVDDVITNQTVNVLHDACSKGQKNLIVKLEELKLNANVIDSEGRAAIHVAALSQSASVVPALHYIGANLNQLDAKKQTAAHIAVAKGDALFINELRKLNMNFHISGKLNVDFHVPDASGKTALSKAIESKQWNMAAYMLLATEPVKKLNEIDLKLLNKNRKLLCDSVISLLKDMGSGNTAIANRTELVASITQKNNSLGIILETKKSRLSFFKKTDYFSMLEKELSPLNMQSLNENGHAPLLRKC